MPCRIKSSTFEIKIPTNGIIAISLEDFSGLLRVLFEDIEERSIGAVKIISIKPTKNSDNEYQMHLDVSGFKVFLTATFFESSNVMIQGKISVEGHQDEEISWRVRGAFIATVIDQARKMFSEEICA